MTREEWNVQHSACPACGNTENICTTLAGVVETKNEDGNVSYEDNINTATCQCGWKGNVSEMVPANTGSQKAPQPVRVIDYEGETYVCTKDVVSTVMDYEANITALLKTPDQINYTRMLLSEVVKMLAAVDRQHWTNKLYAAQAEQKPESSNSSEPHITE